MGHTWFDTENGRACDVCGTSQSRLRFSVDEDAPRYPIPQRYCWPLGEKRISPAKCAELYNKPMFLLCCNVWDCVGHHTIRFSHKRGLHARCVTNHNHRRALPASFVMKMVGAKPLTYKGHSI